MKSKFLNILLFALLFLCSNLVFAQSDPILERAKAGVRQHRMGDLVIKVVDSKGQPVPGAEVRVEMLRHQFLFGSNIFMWGRFALARDEQIYRDRFADLFNYATLPFYWADYEKKEGMPEHEYREQVAKWCQEKKVTAKGHPLIWTYPGSVPKWLPDNPEEVRRLAANRVTDCVTRFKGQIDIWDVVNEAVDPYASRDPLNWKDNRLEMAFQRIGTVTMVKDMFGAARAAYPQATLLINDYRIEPKYKDLLDLLRNNGKFVYDAIGIQSHMHDGVWSSQKIWDICQEYARFGVPLHFTETTIVSGKRLWPRENWGPTDRALEEKQAKEAERFYTILFGHPAIEAITWWDFADRGAWQGAAAGFLRKDLSPKPIYSTLRKLIREDWCSKMHLQTGHKGIAQMHAFYGDYRITAIKNTASASRLISHDRRIRENKAELKLGEIN